MAEHTRGGRSELNGAFQALVSVVQTNCDIADARHAGDYTLCVYLLKMREYYRWEKGYGYHDPLPKDEVGEWLVARESRWDTLRDAPFNPLPLRGQHLDPFDADDVNHTLVPNGYVYSAGLGLGARPHFFLGRLERSERHNGFTVLVSAEELARDLSAPPAMTRGRTIFVRRESLRRMLWEKVEEWRWNRTQNTLSRALAHYDFDKDEARALDAMTGREIETVLRHELGEAMAGELLGEAWHELLFSLPRSPVELMARAVRDHLADCISTLPCLLERDDDASLDFYMANFKGMRREIFPTLVSAYRQASADDDRAPLWEAVRAGEAHWLETARRMLTLHRQHGAQAHEHLSTLIETRRL